MHENIDCTGTVKLVIIAERNWNWDWTLYDVETTAFNVTGNSFELVAQKVLTINNICRVTIHNSIFLIPH